MLQTSLLGNGKDGGGVKVQLCHREILRLDMEVKKGIMEVEEMSDMSTLSLNALVQNVKQQMKQLDEKINQLHSLTFEVGKAVAREELKVEVEKHRTECGRNVQALRKATLRAMNSIENHSRQQLLTNGYEDSTTHTQLKHRKHGEGMASQSSQVTENLTMLAARMNDQVKQSEETLGRLHNSSQVLGEVETEFALMGGTIQSGGKLLSKYSRRECTDRILISLALLLFFCVVLYIVKKRIGLRLW